MAVARAAGIGCALEAGAAQEAFDLFFDRSLEDELGAQATELAQPFELVAIALT